MPASTDVTSWHNPCFFKSRATLELLRARGIEPIVDYQKRPPENVLAIL